MTQFRRSFTKQNEAEIHMFGEIFADVSCMGGVFLLLLIKDERRLKLFDAINEISICASGVLNTLLLLCCSRE